MNTELRHLIPDTYKTTTDHNHFADALVQVNKMHNDLNDANAAIQQLRADLHREQDRVAMMVEERDRYRHESVRFRKLLIQQSTKMVNAALILEAAKDTLMEVEEIDAGDTPTSSAIDKLDKLFDEAEKAMKAKEAS